MSVIVKIDEAAMAAVAPPAPDTTIEDCVTHHGDADITVVARYPYQMQGCQNQLIKWCESRVASMKEEVDDLSANLDIAVKSGWATGSLDRAHRRAMRTVEYYEKMKAALLAGYCIVPNFPVDMFAIRTTKNKPEAKENKYRYPGDSHFEQSPQMLPIGEGRYVDPTPEIYGREYPTGKDGAMETYSYAKYFRDAIDFPFALARTEVLSAASRALSDKVFDEIGVLPGRKPKGDPIVIGRIRDPRAPKHSPRVVSFLIAWYVDTREL